MGKNNLNIFNFNKLLDEVKIKLCALTECFTSFETTEKSFKKFEINYNQLIACYKKSS